ncbi:hypothetical protein GCM10008905_32830 [Clostridium malenominatum]|uniref:Uncharacterized protein n=1 Tax=Clostridium malenominatum TaxID=1539 RepID=A0ABN1J7G8_9CLOT
MRVIIESLDENYAFCRREDKILIQIPLRFLNEAKIGNIIYLPDTRRLN